MTLDTELQPGLHSTHLCLRSVRYIFLDTQATLSPTVTTVPAMQEPSTESCEPSTEF